MEEPKRDVLIIGGGPAGLSAALWCADLGLSSLILEKSAELGGQLLQIYNPIENYLGVSAANGLELRDRFVKSLTKVDPEYLFNIKIANVDVEKKIITLEDGRVFHGRSIIIATGVRRRELGIEGERRFAGKGILASGAKDPKVARGKRVAVIGGGDAAVENALILSEFAEKVVLIHRGPSLSARHEFVDRILSHPKVEIRLDTIVEAFGGESVLTHVTICQLPESVVENIAVDAAVIRIGFVPNSEPFRGHVDIDARDYIVTDKHGRTSAKLIYAAGDVAAPTEPTISGSAGAGANAAKAIANSLCVAGHAPPPFQ